MREMFKAKCDWNVCLDSIVLRKPNHMRKSGWSISRQQNVRKIGSEHILERSTLFVYIRER